MSGDMSMAGDVGGEPKRIQRRRAKGWRKPKGAVYVGRGSPWGNPFVTGKHGTARACKRLYRWMCQMNLLCVSMDSECANAQVESMKQVRDHIAELRGKDLMCWCPLDGPCHADYLLEIANREE